jgi:hypothetical protein
MPWLFPPSGGTPESGRRYFPEQPLPLLSNLNGEKMLAG